MSIVRKIRRTLRGEVAPTAAARELLRRSRVRLDRRRERARLGNLQARAARLCPAFAAMTGAELLDHFRTRSQPAFLPGFSLDAGQLQSTLFPEATQNLLSHAERIVNQHSWPLLGIGETNFGEQIDWHRDPLSQFHWPLDYHADLNLLRDDGSDVRVLWELNRLSHFLTLARAYAVSKDKRFAAEFFDQLESWDSQNPYGMGVNWNCAMEVALRAINLLGAFEIFRHSELLDEQKLARVLAIFDQHGNFIRDNLEFSHIATSNHYLSDVVGLVWLGIMLPELQSANDWREFGLREMLRQMDHQVLPDGADFEASTGYHRLVLELFLFTFLICRANNVEIENRYWTRLRQMVRFVRAYLRPDGRAPLVGDTDSGQIFPITKRAADDHAYVLAIGAVAFADAKLTVPNQQVPEELLWTLGEAGISEFEALQRDSEIPRSEAFPDAGIYILREGDLYLLFNASHAGIHGRGSHGHNDALCLEVSACGRAFIVDPGTYLYTGNLEERHRFRSAAYHSTVTIDEAEQNTTDPRAPFVIGNEAKPKVVAWETTDESDFVSAEQSGYARLAESVTHRRKVTFHKSRRYWLVEDEFDGTGEHRLDVRFHFDTGLDVSLLDEKTVSAYDKQTGAKLLVKSLDLQSQPVFEEQFVSRDYGSKQPSVSARWSVTHKVPLKFRWALVPVCSGEDEAQRLQMIQRENHEHRSY
ncbi:MAG TPA: alginate lyase family protein [Pyrinomonadaceae bacterium]|nr:alginate lyase family protein [Pyrinomonadaceae bacterium]